MRTYEIGEVLNIEGKNYEVVEGSANTFYNACGKCAFCKNPGECLISKYSDLMGNCASQRRSDRKDVHYVESTKEATVFYPEKTNNNYMAEASNDSHSQTTDNHIGVCEITTEEPKQTVGAPSLNVVRAKDLNGNDVEGVLIITEDGSKFIMPYGAKVLMDGSCNLIQFNNETLSYLTPYRDANGKQIYTGDRLMVTVISNGNLKDYTTSIVEAKKNGVVPLFYKNGTDEHASEVAISDNTVINGIVMDDK